MFGIAVDVVCGGDRGLRPALRTVDFSTSLASIRLAAPDNLLPGLGRPRQPMGTFSRLGRSAQDNALASIVGQSFGCAGRSGGHLGGRGVFPQTGSVALASAVPLPAGG